MEKLKGNNFNLNKGEYVLIKPKKITFDNSMREIVGVIRNYDNVNSKSGCFLNGWIRYYLSGIVKEIKYPFVIAWYRGGFLLLSELESIDYKNTAFERGINLFKLDKKDIRKFKEYIIKKEMIEGLK